MKALEYSAIGAIQIPYNLFDHRLDRCGFFTKAKEQGVIVFARSSLLQGLIMMNPEQLPPRVSFAKEYLMQFRFLCEKYSVSPLDAAVGFVGSKPEIDYIVFGADNMRQLNEYISMKNTVLPNGLLKEIEDMFLTVDERLVNPSLWR